MRGFHLGTPGFVAACVVSLPHLRRCNRRKSFCQTMSSALPSIFSRPRRRTAFRGPAITQKNSTRAVSLGGTTSYTFADIQPKDIHAQTLSQRPLLAPRQIARSGPTHRMCTLRYRVRMLTLVLTLCSRLATNRSELSCSMHREQLRQALDVHDAEQAAPGGCSSRPGT